MLEQLVQLEPYASFRFLLGLVLTGLFVWTTASSLIGLWESWKLLDDLDKMARGQRLLDAARPLLYETRPAAALYQPQARPGRTLRNLLLVQLLRQISWRNAWALKYDLLALVMLSVANIWAYIFIFMYG